MQPSPKTARVLSLDETSPTLNLVDHGGHATALVWPGNGAISRTMHLITLEHGAATKVQKHPGEAVYYVRSGAGTVIDPDTMCRDDVIEGSMIFVEPGTAYRFEAGSQGLDLVGGPCPADPTLYDSI